MLAELRIKDFTIISDLRVSFAEGLNLLTGETGTGKSVIVDALSMFLTPRASLDMIKSGTKEAQIEALFYCPRHPLLDELSINHKEDEGIILRRVLSSQGRTKAYINDTPVSVQSLITIGSSLIAIHGQHEHQNLLRREAHCDILDRYAGLLDSIKEYQSVYNRANALAVDIEGLRRDIRERARREEFLRHQIEEINGADLKVDEMEGLIEERGMLSNISRLRGASEDAYYNLYEAEGAALERLKRTAVSLREIEEFDSSVKEITGLLHAAMPLIDDAASILRSKRESYEANPVRLEEIDNRLELIKRLQKKYGDTVEEILGFRDRSEVELSGLVSSGERLQTVESELESVLKYLRDMADSISLRRVAASKEMQALMIKELKNLGFKDAIFSVSIERSLELSPRGIDQVEFLFSANPGEPLKPISKIASGGELSRVMLALKAITLRRGKLEFSNYNNDPETVIFDEVDAGIGGVTAVQVGKRLKDISQSYQSLCITHLPQIAALADHHLKIEKITSGDRVSVVISELDEQGRRMEIARMLSGAVTENSLRHADELLTRSP